MARGFGFTMPLLFWGAAIGAAIGAVGSYFSARNVNRSQQSYAERLSSTAHLREVQDLRTAGLNPILSAGGRGASTPSPKQNVPGERLVEASVSAARLALEKKAVIAQVGKTEAETDAIRAQVPKREAQATFWRWLNNFIKGAEGSATADIGRKLLQKFRGKFETATQKAIGDALDEFERRKMDKRSIEAIRRGLRRGKER